MAQHILRHPIRSSRHIPARLTHIRRREQNSETLDRAVSLVCVLDGLVVLAWFMLIPVHEISWFIKTGFVLAGLLNILFAASVYIGVRNSPGAQTSFVMGQLGTIPELLAFVGERTKRNKAVSTAITAAFLINLLVVFVL